ncbi:MAG: hypothetical protein ABEJ71_03250 [Halodesulfurarchaeum sp.]
MGRDDAASSILRSADDDDQDERLLEIEGKEGFVSRFRGGPESVYKWVMAVDSRGPSHAEHRKHHHPFEGLR